MANTRSAGKRARQTAKRTLRNRSVLGRLRTLQKKGTADVRALISEIVPGGPAAQVGMKAGDVITEFGGKRIDDPRHLLCCPRAVS